MDTCITPLPEVKDVHDTSGGAVEKWPKRLNVVPPRVRSGSIQGITARTFNDDTQLWRKRVSQYRVILGSLSDGRFRNIMDMNAGLGGFAAALANYPVWVMNVIPHDLKNNTIGVMYDRGLIGTYMNWCEAFSTYPRTYDLIHADGIFTMYQDKCDAAHILVEIYRIIRPDGVLIVRDHVDVVMKVKDIVETMTWSGRVYHGEKGPYHSEKILLVDNSRPAA